MYKMEQVTRKYFFKALQWLIAVSTLVLYSQAMANDFWNKNYTSIDSVAKRQKATSVEVLAKKLTQNIEATDEKYRALFTWMAYNISYDVPALKNIQLRTADPYKVFKNKRGVCAGYAGLFKKLCELNQLPCITIAGKGATTADIGQQYQHMPNHDWNAIQINQQWYLVDVTWAAGYVEITKGKFTFEFKPLYFCCPPNYFVYNHYPLDTQWLLGADVSKEKFDSTLFCYYTVFEFKIENIQPSTAILTNKKNDVISFEFQSPSTISRISIKGNKQSKSEEIPFTIMQQKISFTYSPPKDNESFTIYLNGKACFLYKIKK
jgi:transglutaminase/protease-like cytokinesis protein 3